MVGLRASTWMLLAGGVFSLLPGCAFDNSSCHSPRWHSPEWYAERAADPPGTRQADKHGKLWPPYPRPIGREQAFWHKFHHNHYWPYPYNCQDREYVHTAFQQQTNNGWETAMTLHDYHFDPETNHLNSAGELHLKWILTQAPNQYRMAYVARGPSEEIAQFRLADVQESAREICGDNLPPILLKHDVFLGRPAIEIDTLRRLELQSIPQPRLFIISASGTGSASGPSSAQSGGASGQPQSGGASSMIK